MDAEWDWCGCNHDYPCGCGHPKCVCSKDDVEVIHWRGGHWMIGCAFPVALKEREAAAMSVPGLREVLVHIRDMASDPSDDLTGLGRPRIIAGLARQALDRFCPQSGGEPTGVDITGNYGAVFAREQVQAQTLAAVLAEKERCAKLCDERAAELRAEADKSPWTESAAGLRGDAALADELAAAIREGKADGH